MKIYYIVLFKKKKFTQFFPINQLNLDSEMCYCSYCCLLVMDTVDLVCGEGCVTGGGKGVLYLN